jgi:hypothetical protein
MGLLNLYFDRMGMSCRLKEIVERAAPSVLNGILDCPDKPVCTKKDKE